MDAIEVTFKTITPLFLGGGDGKTPELRAPSIKGMMRFWWRAMKGHSSIEELRKEEDKWFGSSDEKIGSSSFSLRIFDIQPDNNKQGISLTPHHDDKYCSSTDASKACNYRNEKCMKAIKREGYFLGKFTIRVTSRASDKAASIENILKITTILGGLGKRSRRGFGSVKIVKINGSDFSFDYSLTSICKVLNAVVPNGFEVDVDKIKKRCITASKDLDYPYIEEIEIGNGCEKYEELLKIIGKSSHDNKSNYTGFAHGQERFASPIYVSVIKDGTIYKPIITRLHAAFKPVPFSQTPVPDNSAAFITAILTKAVGGCK